MRTLTNIALATALAVSGAFGTVAMSTGEAEAKTYTKHEYINRDKCYRVKKVPATVEYNTRGIKLQDASRSWVGNLRKHGAKVKDQYNDEVYLQTRRVIEDQHYTLVPTGCH